MLKSESVGCEIGHRGPPSGQKCPGLNRNHCNLRPLFKHISSFSAWCLKNENVHCVLLGAASVDQLYENMQALQVFYPFILSV